MPSSLDFLMYLFIFYYCAILFCLYYGELRGFKLNKAAVKAPPIVKHWSSELEINNPSFRNNKRIFFHETSGKGALDFKQTCCIESAAKHHPNRPVQVFLSADNLPFHHPWLDVFSYYSNIEVYLLDNHVYFKGSELEDWYVKGMWKTSPFRRAHLSDYLRINTVSRGGGLYFDLDLVIHQPFEGEAFQNFLVFESQSLDMIANTIFHLDTGHRLVKEILKLIASEYDPAEYIFHGPEAITAAMHNLCGFHRGHSSSNNCSDIKVHPHTIMNPVDSMFSNIYFNEDGLKEEWRNKVRKSRAIHHFSSLTRAQAGSNLTVEMNTNSLFALLARENCPHTVLYNANFESYLRF